MKKIRFILVLGFILSGCFAKEPRMPAKGSIPFMVLIETHHRALCVGVLVSRMAVLTAAICVVNVEGPYDTRPLNVITGTHYRHEMRGIKVQVTRIIIPKLLENPGSRGYQMQKSAALLLLRRKVPDILTEEPLRAISVDYKWEETLNLQDECIMLGWHFFYKGDKILPGGKYILQRNLRFQQLVLVNKEVYCDTLVLKYEKATDELGNNRVFRKDDVMCLRDPDFSAQPCHGMYGAPVICGAGRVMGMMTAVDAQWSNCTGFSVLAHELRNRRNRAFFDCVHPLFEPEVVVNWAQIKYDQQGLAFDPEEEVIKQIYDGVITDFSSTSDELLG